MPLERAMLSCIRHDIRGLHVSLVLNIVKDPSFYRLLNLLQEHAIGVLESCASLRQRHRM